MASIISSQWQVWPSSGLLLWWLFLDIYLESPLRRAHSKTKVSLKSPLENIKKARWSLFQKGRKQDFAGIYTINLPSGFCSTATSDFRTLCPHSKQMPWPACDLLPLFRRPRCTTKTLSSLPLAILTLAPAVTACDMSMHFCLFLSSYLHVLRRLKRKSSC